MDEPGAQSTGEIEPRWKQAGQVVDAPGTVKTLLKLGDTIVWERGHGHYGSCRSNS